MLGEKGSFIRYDGPVSKGISIEHPHSLK